MSESNWNSKPPFRGVEFAIVAFFAAITFWLPYRYEHTEERERAAHEDKQRALSSCLILEEPTLVATCLANTEDAQYYYSAETAGLKAQQDMAEYALLMLVFTVVGVFYLARTLYTTNQTLDEARVATKAAQDTVNVTEKMGRAQVRAYLDVKEIRVYFDPSGDRLDPFPLEVRASIKLQNSGNSPARDVEYVIEPEIRNLTQQFMINTDREPVGGKTPVVAVPAQTISDELGPLKIPDFSISRDQAHAGFILCFYCKVIFRDVFKIREEIYLVSYTAMPEGDPFMASKTGNVMHLQPRRDKEDEEGTQ